MTSAASPGRRAPATLEMVAAEAGVSRSTVSRVVNRSPRVSPDAVDSVSAAIRKLNYVPNRAARSLAIRQTMAVALVVPEETSRFFGDPYFAAVISGIMSRLDESDYVLNLLVASSDPGHKTTRYLLGGNVDGALVVSHHRSGQSFAEVGTLIPVVFGGRPVGSNEGEPHYVDVDNVGGGRMAAEHLLAHGHRRIATITGPLDMPGGIDRLRGWRDALAEAGRPTDLVANGDFTAEGGERAMAELLDRDPDLDAVFAASDLMATGAIATLSRRGRSVPADVAVIGYDDSPGAAAGPVPLTTIGQPSVEMGARMADMLLGLLHGEPEAEAPLILPARLVRRASA
jgi:DNA-binding LacI/PurR family transcriptional regulator